MKFKLYFSTFCIFALSLNPLPIDAKSNLFFITTDYSTGNTAYLRKNTEAAETNILGIHSDAVGHYHDGKIYIVNRLGQDNILILGEEDPSLPLLQFSVGNGSNPHDIEIVANDKAYVTLYERSELLIVDPRDGTERGRIDLSLFSDSDGLPEASQIVRHRDHVYISCQRLDRNTTWGPASTSLIVVINILTDEIVDVDPSSAGVQAITLNASNPNRMFVMGDELIVSGSAHFGDQNGGIDIVDLDKWESKGIAISESAFAGDINAITMVDNEKGFAVVSDNNWINHVYPFDLSNGSVGQALNNLSGGYVADIAVDENVLIVADQGSISDPNSVGIKLFDIESGRILGDPISTGLPPANIIVLKQRPLPTVVFQTRAVPQYSALHPAYPNPFNSAVTIPFTLRNTDFVNLIIYDALGQKVQHLVSGTFAAGHNHIIWDGRNTYGQNVGSGIYFANFSTSNTAQMAKLVLIK